MSAQPFSFVEAATQHGDNWSEFGNAPSKIFIDSKPANWRDDTNTKSIVRGQLAPVDVGPLLDLYPPMVVYFNGGAFAYREGYAPGDPLGLDAWSTYKAIADLVTQETER